MKTSILFVDDDALMLEAIRREFFNHDMEIFTADNGDEALDILSKQKIEILVIDIMMPGMNGYEFLKKVKERYPETVRLALSSYTDEALVIRMLNQNMIKSYMSKPWGGNELIRTVQEIGELNARLNNPHIRALINSTDILNTLPRMYHDINMLIEDDSSNIDDIVKLIGTDQSISARVLKTINSAFYGVKTGSVKTAVLNLGLQNLKSVIAAVELFGESDQYYEEMIWKHSNLVNIYAVKLYEHIYGKRIPELYSIAGLLHDVGKVVFFKLFYPRYGSVLKLIEGDPTIPLEVCEKNIFGYTHEEIGAILLDYWDMPAALVQTVLYHNVPEMASEQYRDIVSIVNLSDYFSWKAMDSKFAQDMSKEAIQYLGVSEKELEAFIKHLEIQ